MWKKKRRKLRALRRSTNKKERPVRKKRERNKIKTQNLKLLTKRKTVKICKKRKKESMRRIPEIRMRNRNTKRGKQGRKRVEVGAGLEAEDLRQGRMMNPESGREEEARARVEVEAEVEAGWKEVREVEAGIGTKGKEAEVEVGVGMRDIFGEKKSKVEGLLVFFVHHLSRLLHTDDGMI